MVESLDLVIIAFAVFLVIKGVWKGLINEVTGLLAVIVGVLVSFVFCDALAELLRVFSDSKYLPFVSYAVLFVVSYIAIMLLGKLIDKVLKRLMLGVFNRILGGAFGLLKAFMWVSLSVYAYIKLQEQNGFDEPELVQASLFYPYFEDFVLLLEARL